MLSLGVINDVQRKSKHERKVSACKRKPIKTGLRGTLIKLVPIYMNDVSAKKTLLDFIVFLICMECFRDQFV